MIYLSNIDLNKNQLMNAVIQPLAVAPTSPKLGQIYYNSTDKCLYQYNGTAWKRVGVVYEEESAAGKILTGLSADGSVHTAQVKDLQLKGITPVEGGYVAEGDSLETAIKALDTAVKNAVSGGGEVNQFAFSNVKVGTITVTATGKTDTIELVAGNYITLTANSANKTVTIAVNIPEATTSAPGLMSSSAATKLAGIEEGAQKNVKPDWNASSGNPAEILNKPTKLSEFTNDENFIDNTVANLVNYYNKDDINTLLGNLALISIQVVETLPTTGKSNIIYLKPKATADGDTNSYDEYLWTGTKFERIGDTTIDLSDYLTKTGNASDTTVTFTTASSRTAPAPGESLSILLGKISKYLADLKTVAFTNSYNDLNDKPTMVVHYATGTLDAGSTTAIVNFTGTFIHAAVRDAVTGEEVLADVETGTNKATVTLASAHANNLIISVMYS